jgi:hypothetical protein
MIAYYCKKAINPKTNKQKNFNEAYSAVWHGVDACSTELKNILMTYQHRIIIYVKHVKDIDTQQTVKKDSISNILYQTNKLNINNQKKYDIPHIPQKIDFVPFQGYSSLLGHYYRHLFQTVKYVVMQDYLSYEKKRNYLRMLRAQMSNPEQTLLFYNWLSGYGDKWECEENHFLTDYRMIHNVWQEMVIKDFDIKEIITKRNPDYKTEENRINDCLFEFQDN